jgi:hypothetical protein
LLTIGRRFDDAHWIVGCRAGRWIHGSLDDGGMRHWLLADHRGDVRGRLHYVGLLHHVRLGSNHRLLGGGRLLGRGWHRLRHHVRLLGHGTLIDRVRLRHERIHRRGGEHPSGDSR